MSADAGHERRAHTVDIGPVHVLTEPGGPCVPACPHPTHRREWSYIDRQTELTGADVQDGRLTYTTESAPARSPSRKGDSAAASP